MGFCAGCLFTGHVVSLSLLSSKIPNSAYGVWISIEVKKKKKEKAVGDFWNKQWFLK